MENKAVTTYIPSDLHEWLKDYAQAQRPMLTMAQLLRMALYDFQAANIDNGAGANQAAQLASNSQTLDNMPAINSVPEPDTETEATQPDVNASDLDALSI